MVIIIDGYNLIFTVPELEKYVERMRIESVRDFVISLLSEYRKEKAHKIVLVFDGTYSETTLPRKQMLFNITVIYSKTGVTADTEIKNITSLSQNPNDISIVTYDNDIKRHVKKCGSQIIDPKVFYKEILDALNNYTKQESEELNRKISNQSEQDVQYWTEIFKNLPPPKEEPNPHIKKADTLPAEKKNKNSPVNQEPYEKHHTPSSDDTEYWVRMFEGQEEDEQ